MPLSHEDRAQLAVDELKGLVAGQIAAAVSQSIAEERRGLRATLQLAVMVFDQLLALPDVPEALRVSARVCRGLCTDALEDTPAAGDLPRAAPAAPDEMTCAAGRQAKG